MNKSELAHFSTENRRQAREAAIAFLGLAKKPSGRVRQRLLARGFAAELVEQVIEQLTEDGYLDDLALARRTVRQRQGSKAESHQALAWRLQQAGIAKSARQAALLEALPDDDLARGLWQARFEPAWQKLCSDAADPADKRKYLAKTARFMTGRGFSAGLVSRLLPFMDD